MPESTLNYLAPMTERPYYYLVEPPAGTPPRNTVGDRHALTIHDARELTPAPTLDREGFALVRHATAVDDLYDPDAVRSAYYAEIENLVADFTGAARVIAFDHNVRNRAFAERHERGAQDPVRLVHNDYTERSGPQRVRDLMGDEADALLQRRFAVINVWKPIRGPVEEWPLAFCDAQSMQQEDFIPSDLRYNNRTGEIYSLAFRPGHRWYYYSAMQADEALLLKCYDSAPDRARFTAHTAFEDPTSPTGAAPRESIEVRTMAFFP